MKKAISPVVATALLLVVAIVFVVGFQTWFNSYSENLEPTFWEIDKIGTSDNLIMNCVFHVDNGFSEERLKCEVKSCMFYNNETFCSSENQWFNLESD